jgi:hypothetical protein
MNIFGEDIPGDLNLDSRFDKLFQPTKKLEYLDNNLDLEISTSKFIEWLTLENDYMTGVYKEDVSSMCEYSCLYLSMLFFYEKLDGELKIYTGNYGFWEHFWMGYDYKGTTYFIDLTLVQFEDDAPRLSITKLDENNKNGSYEWDDEHIIDIKEYVESKGAFGFYTNPHTMKKPKVYDYIKSNPFNSLNDISL